MTMPEIWLSCQFCDWSGYPYELVTLTDDPDDNDFSRCPRCGGSMFDEIEEGDDEAEDSP